MKYEIHDLGTNRFETLEFADGVEARKYAETRANEKGYMFSVFACDVKHTLVCEVKPSREVLLDENFVEKDNPK